MSFGLSRDKPAVEEYRWPKAVAKFFIVAAVIPTAERRGRAARSAYRLTRPAAMVGKLSVPTRHVVEVYDPR